MAQAHVKVVVTGAAGHIGYALVYRIASGQMFGPDTLVTLKLLELEHSLPALEGVAMELDDCAFGLLKGIESTADINESMNGANWVICVGAVPRKKGMERSDLLEINGGIFTGTGRAINENAADDVQVLVVGNPCNTNCLIAMNNAPDVPKDRFFAMTMLDELRARSLLSRKVKVPITDIKDMIIWGNHSATQYPDFYNAKIRGDSAVEVVNDEPWLQTDFVSKVQQRGAEIIKARGASSAASAANAIIASVVAITTDTPSDDSFSVCLASKGDYGVDEGLIFSFPCKTAKGVVSVVKDIKHNEFASTKISATLDELTKEKEIVLAKGLI